MGGGDVVDMLSVLPIGVWMKEYVCLACVG